MIIAVKFMIQKSLEAKLPTIEPGSLVTAAIEMSVVY